MTELLVKHGASVNACDLWRFTPLHEGAAKGKYEIVKLLLKHGADPTKKNRDGHTPIDLVKEADQVGVGLGVDLGVGLVAAVVQGSVKMLITTDCNETNPF